MGDNNWRGKVRNGLNVIKAFQGNLESSEESGYARGKENKRKGRCTPPERPPEPQHQPLPNNQQAFGDQGYPRQSYPDQGYQDQGYPGQGYPGQGYPGQGHLGQGSGYSSPVYPAPDYSRHGGGYSVHSTQTFHDQGNQPQPNHEPHVHRPPPQQADARFYGSSTGPPGSIAPGPAQSYLPISAQPGLPTGQAQSYYNQPPVDSSQGYPQRAYSYSQNPSYNPQQDFTHGRPASHQSQLNYDANSQQQPTSQNYSQYPSDSSPSSGYLRRVDTAPAAMTCQHGTRNNSSYVLSCFFTL